MNWNYEEKLIEYIAQAKRDSGLGDDYIFEVCTEQIFAKLSTLTPNTIYVVVKYLSSTNSLNSVIQPIQLIISCEQNQIQTSQIIFSKLVEQHNFEAIIENGTYVKQDYREPVVLSNFNEVSYGYRTIMYISATLFIMEDVIDITDVRIGVNGLWYEDLNRQELQEAECCFEEGNTTTEMSTKFAVKTADLNEKWISENISEGYGFFLSGQETEDSEEIGFLKVGNVRCASFFIIYNQCVLKNVVGDTIETINFADVDVLTFEFYPMMNIFSGNQYIINSVDYYKVFPGVVKQKQNGYNSYEKIKAINFSIVYAMTPNTQPIPPAKIATSVKSVATFAISFTVPLVNTYMFIRAISDIMAENISGNTTFYITFDLGSVNFDKIPMKLTNAQVTTAINEVPGLQIGMIK